MSDRIAVMNHGRVEQLGTPEALYERPATRFVADFIGTTNLLRGAIETLQPDGALVRLASGEACRVGSGDLVAGTPVELSVRPEAIVLTPANRTAPSALHLRGEIEQVAYLGGNVQYLVRTGGGLAITALVAKSRERLPVGHPVDVTWAPGDALILATTAGEPTGEEVRA